MKISFIAGEVAPFATSGGLGDVMSALPTCIAKDSEHSVEVIVPLYGTLLKCEKLGTSVVSFE
jgi:starch synthase